MGVGRVGDHRGALERCGPHLRVRPGHDLFGLPDPAVDDRTVHVVQLDQT
jgi:hypothetical protein